MNCRDRGKFITLEGGEGVGKSTNLNFLENLLRNKNIPLVVTREPGGTALAEKIRLILLDKAGESICPTAELLLIFAARAQHIQHVIEPALTRGQWVLCDRFTDATFAYQGGARHMDVAAIAWLEKLVQGSLRPDLTLLLDAPVDIGFGRARQRDRELDRFEAEKSQFFEDVRSAYLKRAELFPERIKIIAADHPLAEVQARLRDILDDFLG